MVDMIPDLMGSQVIQSLSHGSQAVGRAGCRRNYGIFRLQGIMVDIVNDGGKVIACGSRDDNLLSACSDMRKAFFLDV